MGPLRKVVSNSATQKMMSIAVPGDAVWTTLLVCLLLH